ncbi:hypothetical protein STVA_14310 [Allostella vacuolata]|nr:hypothetical protein STVA_14310 [Stella vacuolata]
MDMIRTLRRLLLALAALLAAGMPAAAHQGHGHGHPMQAERTQADSGSVPAARDVGPVPCHGHAMPAPDPAGTPAPERDQAPTGADGHGCAGAWGCCLALRREVDPGRMAPPRHAALGLPPSDTRAGRIPLVESRPPIRDRD